MRKPSNLVVLTTILAAPILLTACLTAVSGPTRLVAATSDTAAAPAGKAAFVELKCSLCHSIDSQGIERKSKSEKTKGPDLSTIGATHDAAWLGKFLRKEVANADGKKHDKDFKGTPEQLQQIADFLASLKTK